MFWTVNVNDKTVGVQDIYNSHRCHALSGGVVYFYIPDLRIGGGPDPQLGERENKTVGERDLGGNQPPAPCEHPPGGDLSPSDTPWPL